MRYMSIDKFIDLISNKCLFLTPLSFYSKTDPFEGHKPKVLFEAFMGVLSEPFKEIEATNQQLESLSVAKDDYDNIQKIKVKMAKYKENLVPLSLKVSQSPCVNCWYHSELESEAMWKLYSDSGKGIAIKTSVSSLLSAINSCPQAIPLNLGKVKYLDFLSKALKTEDCFSDGITSPLLKRKEYEHENEVRLYSTPQLNYGEWEMYTPKPMFVNIDISKLIEAIYISPYVNEPFSSSVHTLCDLFNIPKSKVIKSSLLEDYGKVLDGFKL